MGRVPWTACVWPGLPQLWRQGSWFGLAAAVAFAAAMNFALVNSLIWTDWFGAVWRTMAWTTAGAIWLAGVAWTWRQESRNTSNAAAKVTPNPCSPTEDLFSAATREYLQGNWVSTHEKLDQLLAKNNDDVEARLLLATLYRRTGRMSDAQAELDRLTKMEKAATWQLEIDRELELIRKAASAPPATSTVGEPEPMMPTCKAA